MLFIRKRKADAAQPFNDSLGVVETETFGRLAVCESSLGADGLWSALFVSERSDVLLGRECPGSDGADETWVLGMPSEESLKSVAKGELAVEPCIMSEECVYVMRIGSGKGQTAEINVCKGLSECDGIKDKRSSLVFNAVSIGEGEIMKAKFALNRYDVTDLSAKEKRSRIWLRCGMAAAFGSAIAAFGSLALLICGIFVNGDPSWYAIGVFIVSVLALPCMGVGVAGIVPAMKGNDISRDYSLKEGNETEGIMITMTERKSRFVFSIVMGAAYLLVASAAAICL